MSTEKAPGPKLWPHAPPHFLAGAGSYMVTAGTFRKERHYNTPERLDYLTGSLLEHAVEYGWEVQAWSVFSNHYHFIARSPDESAENLSSFIKTLHRRASTWINRADGVTGRKVWHNYRETELTYEKSYLARMNYVINNPVRHGLVKVASEYPWCSAAWFEREAEPAFQKTVASFKTDKVKVEDDYEV